MCNELIGADKLIAAERALAKWKRKNYRVEKANVNELVKMVQENSRDFDGSELSNAEALRILMLEFKADAYYFTAMVSKRLSMEELDAHE